MQIDIITLFPEFFLSPLNTSILKRAQEKQKVTINCIDLRKYTKDKHSRVDASPYGGGPGMLLQIEPIFYALEDLKTKESLVIMLSPQGTKLQQNIVEELSFKKHIILLCGHYEGFDERVRNYVDMELSLGDYIVSSGNFAALTLCDAITRLLPDVLGCKNSALKDSFSDGLLEYPQYTRPEIFNNMKVPEVLLSGNHQKINEWRKLKSKERTELRRPDLLQGNKNE